MSKQNSYAVDTVSVLGPRICILGIVLTAPNGL